MQAIVNLEQLEARDNPAIDFLNFSAFGEIGNIATNFNQTTQDLVIVAPDLVGKLPASELAGATVLNLDQDADAIWQISAQLSTMRNVGVIRLISHGADGALMLGNQVLDKQVLHLRSSEIAHWGASLAPDADLLLYGCSVASTADGRAFVSDLAALTGANAAASTNPTGADGDIILEYATGQVIHEVGASLADWQLSGLQLPDSSVTSITSAALANFTVFSSGSFQITTSGGSPAANNFFITNGILPAGVTIATTTGVISGIPASGTAGSYALTINASNGVGVPAIQNFTLTVALATQSITWGIPADIVYGAPLGGTQLNANVVGVVGATTSPGKLTYNPASGTVLNAGNQTLMVTAAATVDYLMATKSVTLLVTKASQTITWADPAFITYGTVLGSTQLNASVQGLAGGSAPGALTYAQPSGTLLNAGNQALTVTAATTDNYLVATISVNLNVKKAAPSVSWVNPANISYGTALSSTQLSATATGSSTSGATVPGTLTYSPAEGTLLDAGSQTLVVTAGATNNYLEVTKSVTLIVDKATQTITWNNPTSITYGTLLTATQLNATVKGVTGGTIAGGLTYNPVVGALLNAGSQTLVVTAAATSNYLSATKSVTLVVDKAMQTITWATPANITYGTLLSATQLNATVAGSSTAGATAPSSLTYNPSSGTVLNAGTQTLQVTAAATSNYLEVAKSVTLIVDKAMQTITWANPTSITYGTLLSATQLNATVTGSSTAGTTAPGGLTYNPVSSTLLNAGSQTLVVTAGATNNYLEVTKSVTLIVDKAMQTITWANPTSITYGTLLTATQLNATVKGVTGGTIAGGLTYNPASSTLLDAGTQTLVVTAAATSNYLSATKSVTLVVDKAMQTITWANPTSITYGTLLSATQLNATVAGSSTAGATAPGILTYNPASGTLLDAGTQTLVVTAAATSNYLSATKSVTLIVDKAMQTITWANPTSITYGTLLSTTQLNATVAGSSTAGATTPGILTYNPVSGTLLDAGTQTLVVTTAATSNYLSATKSVTLIVDKAMQTITWANPASITYGTPLSTTQLNATVAGSSTTGTTSPGGLTYNPGSGTVLDAGTQTLQVTAAATSNYLVATKSVTLIVNQAGPSSQTITWATPANITYGTLLNATQLNATVIASGPSAPGALSYSPAVGVLLNAGTQTLLVTAAATNNYAASTKTVTLIVDKATQTITWANPANITYGTPLGATQLNATVAGSSAAGATSPGGLVYDPPAGTLIDAGSCTLNVVAAATGNYLQASRSVTLKVDKAAQTITWANPTSITYGTLLSATQLNATAVGVTGGTVAGGVTYNPASGTLLNAGSQTLVATAAATNNYLPATKSVTLVVDKALQTITWTNPANITYGTLLSATQLNATAAGSSATGATTPGLLTYNPGSGTLLDAGVQTLQVTAAATSNYLEAAKSVALVVDKALQTIIWANPASITYGTLLSTTQLNATVTTSGSSAPGALNYSPALGTLLNAGTQTLLVTAAATGNYAASTKTVTLIVSKSAQTITWATPARIAYGTPLSVQQLNATVVGSSTSGASLPGSLAYTPPVGTVLPLGENTLSVVAAATGNYESASASVVVLVDGVSPVITSPVTTTFLEGVFNSFKVAATGNPVPTYTCTGILPKGLAFNGSTGLLSGIAAEGGLGNYPVTITAGNGVNPNAIQLLNIAVNRYVPVAKGAQLTNPFNLGIGSYVVSLGNGLVLIHNPSGLEQQFQPFPGFAGTLNTSLVDRNGDGEADSVLVAVATGGSPAVLVLDASTGRVAYNFYAFSPSFLGGVSVAGGVTAFQGKVTTVVLGGAGPGSEPSVSAFDAVTGTFRQAFYAFAQQYTGGVRVAMGSPDNRGQSLVVVGSGINSNIVTYTLDNPYAALTSFYAFNPATLYRGVWVAAGDLDGDGVCELVVGAGPGSNGKAEVSVFDLKGKQLANFLAFSQGFTGGVSVAVNDYNRDKKGDIFCSSGAGAPGTFNVFGFPDLRLIDAVFLPTRSLLGTFVGNNPSA